MYLRMVATALHGGKKKEPLKDLVLGLLIPTIYNAASQVHSLPPDA
jgi:hypothetical protein